MIEHQPQLGKASRHRQGGRQLVGPHQQVIGEPALAYLGQRGQHVCSRQPVGVRLIFHQMAQPGQAAADRLGPQPVRRVARARDGEIHPADHPGDQVVRRSHG